MAEAETLQIGPKDSVRFWSKVDKTAAGGCWEWTASKTKNGYGKFRWGAGEKLPHRFAYELLVGPIPSGLHIDHLCRNRACCNPDHLEPVTNRENLLRGDTIPARHAAKTHCPKGHPYAGDNLYIDPTGKRGCLTCRKDAVRRHRDRKKEASNG